MLQLILPSLVGFTSEATAAILYMDNAGGGADGAGLPGQGPPLGGGAGGGGAGQGGPAPARLVDLTGGVDSGPASVRPTPKTTWSAFTVPASGEV